MSHNGDIQNAGASSKPKDSTRDRRLKRPKAYKANHWHRVVSSIHNPNCDRHSNIPDGQIFEKHVVLGAKT